MGESPYRAAPRVMMCPRCGEVLERFSEGIDVCTRCEGLWLANDVLDEAFGSRRWPGGVSAWWRSGLVCPVCTTAGGSDAMTPMLVNELIIDRCEAHGLWLDHGELGRLLGASEALELVVLRARLAPYRVQQTANQARLAAQRTAAERAEWQPVERDLRTVRGNLMLEIEANETELVDLRQRVRVTETRLAEARSRLAAIDRELDAASKR